MNPNKPETGAFHLLDSKIQEELYSLRWEELRAIQVEAIKCIFNTSKHLLISASTASGKTEAAFLPILSQIADNYANGIRAIYVGPLKALINDQFTRLEDLCRRTGIPVHRWHGDVGQSAKREFLGNPGGVLLITPESLESLFINQSNKLTKVFGSLQFAVIDEIHSFMGTERGIHLKSLLSRTASISRSLVRYIGLSATIGDRMDACRWLMHAAPEAVHCLEERAANEIRLRIHAYLLPKKNKTQNADPSENDPLKEIAHDIIRYYDRKFALIFGNAKSRIEIIADQTNRAYGEKAGRILIHHGSLSRSEREFTEVSLKENANPAIVFCSSSMEMGVDFGNISAVGQLDSPPSVNAFSQRLGRSGRKKNEPSTIRCFVTEDEIDRNNSLVDGFCCKLLRTIAITELMLERWCEPPGVDKLHVSTLVQQILSVITQFGGAGIETIYEILVAEGAFHAIGKKLFIGTLRSMKNRDLIEQLEDGTLILGIEGESIVRSFEFYSAFRVEREMDVFHQERPIGSVAQSPDTTPDSFLILSGRRWKVIDIDETHRRIYVVPSRGGKAPLFESKVVTDLHAVVRAKMLDLLVSDQVPVYLDERAREFLSFARRNAEKAGIANEAWFQEGNDVVWFTWTSTKINRTLCALLRRLGCKAFDEGIAIRIEASQVNDIQSRLAASNVANISVRDLVAGFRMLEQEKYDWVLLEDVLESVFYHNQLDVGGADSFLRNHRLPQKPLPSV